MEGIASVLGVSLVGLKMEKEARVTGREPLEESGRRYARRSSQTKQSAAGLVRALNLSITGVTHGQVPAP